MTQKIRKVVVLGVGKVGSMVATLLKQTGFEVTAGDAVARPKLPFPVHTLDVKDAAAVAALLKGGDAVISCLPYDLNIGVAQAAHRAGLHYFDLTEDVPTTNAIREMSARAKGVMAPQCGLAPGFIGIVGASLTAGYDTLRSIELRVGALPRHPRGLLGYAFNWSPEGVVNEYLNDCEVVRNGKPMMVPAMEELETIVIDGLKLEAFTTSGGLGTMCETYSGRVGELNYKTMRYPGHCELMRFFFHELYMRENRKAAGEILVNAKPPVDEDIVYVHAAVEGMKRGELSRDEFVRAYYPLEVEGETWRAISWTTAASACAVVEMVSNGTLAQQGFIKQEEIPFDAFLKTRNGSLYARAH
ncbi:MAG: saccharopine dehydrogenase C-terminal domain-containing protein [Myxococcota bacterium]